MRTVTFSDPTVASEVKSKYVPVWLNRGKGFHNCEKQTEQHIFERSQEAYATRNICTFFMTADAEVVHYVAGYYAPDLFREVLKFVDGIKSSVDRPDQFQEKHRAAAKLCHDEATRIQEAGKKQNGWKAVLNRYGKFKYTAKHTHSAACLHSLEEAMNYWARLHEQFASREEMPSFSSVKAKYLFGNGFSEEPGSKKDTSQEVATGKKTKNR